MTTTIGTTDDCLIRKNLITCDDFGSRFRNCSGPPLYLKDRSGPLEDTSHELYICDYDNGAVYKVVPAK